MISNTIINDIRAEIASSIPTGSGQIFGAAYAYPKSTLAGFPAAVVIPSENEADYASTANDRAVFAFRVMIYYPMKKESEQEKAETAVGEAVGELIKIFSPRGVLSTCDWVEPVPSVWGEAVVGEGVYRTAEVTLRCVKYLAP